MTSNNFTPEIVNNTIDRNVVTSLYGLKGSWQPTDKFTLDFDAYRSTANRPEGGNDTFVTAGLVSAAPYRRDIITSLICRTACPSLNVVIPPSQLGLTACPSGSASSTNAGYCSYTALMNSGFLNNNKYWSTHYDGLNGYSVHDQVTGFTLDGATMRSLGFFDKLLFGVGYNHREKSRADSQQRLDQRLRPVRHAVHDRRLSVAVQSLHLRLAGIQRHLVHESAQFHARRGRIVPVGAAEVEHRPAARVPGEPERQAESVLLYGAAVHHAVQSGEYAAAAEPVQLLSTSTEKTFSFYTEATFAGTNWSGNLGVRVVRTTTMAATAEVGTRGPVDLEWRELGAELQRGLQQRNAIRPAGDLHARAAVAQPELLGGAGQAAVARGGGRDHVASGSQPAGAELPPTKPSTARRNSTTPAPRASSPSRPGRRISRSSGTTSRTRRSTWRCSARKSRTTSTPGRPTNVDLGTMEYDGRPPGTVPGERRSSGPSPPRPTAPRRPTPVSN